MDPETLLSQIDDLTEQIKMLAERENAHYTDIMMQLKELADKLESPHAPLPSLDDREDVYQEAKEIVVELGRASTSYIQQTLGISYEKAREIMDRLEAEGIVAPADGGKPREVLVMEDGE